MPSRILDRRADALSEHDSVLHLALGLVAMSRRLDAALACRSERAEEGGGEADDPVSHFVLGLISFRTTVLAALEAARVPSPSPGPPRAGRRLPRGGLLR